MPPRHRPYRGTARPLVTPIRRAAVAGNPESGGDAGEKSSFSIWIPIGIVAGVLVAAGVVLLVLWKLKKLPWIKE